MPDAQVTASARLAWAFAAPDQDFQPSLSEVHASIRVPQSRQWFRRLLAFAGPGYMVSVGYMDPGNWATDLAGGAKFGYTLLSVIMLSNLMAILLQALSARLGIVTGRDLAQACRDHYSRPSTSPSGSRANWPSSRATWQRLLAQPSRFSSCSAFR